MIQIKLLDIYTGQKLRIIRKKKGFTQQDLAKHIGVTKQQIQKYEAGKNRIAATTLYNIAQILKCSYKDFMLF